MCFVKWPKSCLFMILKQFGEIEDGRINENNQSAVISFKTRAEAEQVKHFTSPPFLLCIVLCWLELWELRSSLLHCPRLTCPPPLGRVPLQAALHGVRFNNLTLRLAWHKPAMTLSAADADGAEPEDDEVCGHYSLCIYLYLFRVTTSQS